MARSERSSKSSNPSPGKIYLVPSLLGPVEPLEVLPMAAKKILDKVDHYLVENEKSARAFIKQVLPSKSQPELELFVLNKYTESAELFHFLEPCRKGQDMALLSEAGAPGIADPGADLISLAHQEHIRVIPLSGPSSILMGMMASGMNGQNFAFTGYLPIDKSERLKAVKNLEKTSLKTGQTQIFMETPYRNQKLLQDLITSCKPGTRLCIACDITLHSEYIQTASIEWWKNHLPDLEKRPTIFILDAQ